MTARQDHLVRIAKADLQSCPAPIIRAGTAIRIMTVLTGDAAMTAHSITDQTDVSEGKTTPNFMTISVLVQKYARVNGADLENVRPVITEMTKVI